MRGSVIIPAHDEQNVIEATLRTLLADLDRDEFEVVVVCNGCRDRTAEMSRTFSPYVQVEEIPEASKVAALNRGDQIATAFPRIYLDADVGLSSRALREIAAVLERPGSLAAEPLPRIELKESALLVRQWYAVWLALHGGTPGRVGGGLLALSKQGRERFGEFPRVIADDLFVRSHFTHEELETVAGAESVVWAPRTLRDLVRIKTRSRLGSFEQLLKFPDLHARQSTQRAPSRRPWQLPIGLWPWFPFYALTTGLIRARALRQSGDLASYTWERDLSSRS